MMEQKRLRFIVNPIAGRNQRKDMGKALMNRIDKSLYDSSLRVTREAGEAERWTREAVAEGIDVVVAVGGDGTVNEVARALVHTSSALGIMPCGSGNGLARHLRIPLDVDKAVAILNAGHTTVLDSGEVDGEPFFCTCGIGFDAFVSLKFAQQGRRGMASYVENALREVISYSPRTYTVNDENGTFSRKAFLIAIANASQYGNNAYIAPRASMHDGLLDVVILEPFTPIEVPAIALQLFNRTILANPRVSTFRTSGLRITVDDKEALHCDGEPREARSEIAIHAVPGSLRVVAPRDTSPQPFTTLQIFADHFREWYGSRAADVQNGMEELRHFQRTLLERLSKL